MIRRGNVRDIEGMLALGKRAHAQLPDYPPIDVVQTHGGNGGAEQTIHRTGG